MKLYKLLKNTTLALLGSTLVLTSCNNNKKQREDLQQAVIATHDSVMTEMGSLMENKTKIENILTNLDSLKSKNTALDTAQVRVDLTKIKTDLIAADEEMMTWMRNFSPDYTGKSDEEVVTYLKDQQTKINSVETSIKNVLFKSDSVITKYK